MFRIRAVESALALIAFTVCVSSAMEPSTPAAVQTPGTVTVTGRVTTSDGKPVANARVYVPGTNEATRTDANGNYSLTGVPGGPQQVVVRQRATSRCRSTRSFRPSAAIGRATMSTSSFLHRARWQRARHSRLGTRRHWTRLASFAANPREGA